MRHTSFRYPEVGVRQHELPDARVQREAVRPGAQRDHQHRGRGVERVACRNQLVTRLQHACQSMLLLGIAWRAHTRSLEQRRAGTGVVGSDASLEVTRLHRDASHPVTRLHDKEVPGHWMEMGPL
jgi:hypothetical protein